MSTTPTIPAILVVSRDPDVRTVASSLLAEGFPTRTADSAAQVQQLLRHSRQWIAILDGDLPRSELERARTALHEDAPVPLLTLIPEGTPSALHLDPSPFPTDEFAMKPLRLAELSLRVKAIALRAGYDVPIHHPSASAASPGQPGHPPLGKVIAVFSGKGGVGKSTIASHLAIGLIQFHRFRTLLADGDLWYGDLGFLLNIASKKSIFDLCTGDQLDASTVQRALVRHESGLSVLLRPEEMVAAEKVDAGTIEHCLAVARSIFDYIVVDTRSAMDEVTLQILDTADEILLVTTPEVSSIANSSRFLGMTDGLGYRAKTRLILNRVNSGIETASLESTLQMKVAATIISAGNTVVRAANEGTILFAKDPDETHQITRDLARLPELVSGEQRKGDRKDTPKSAAPGRPGFSLGLKKRWSY